MIQVSALGGTFDIVGSLSHIFLHLQINTFNSFTLCRQMDHNSVLVSGTKWGALCFMYFYVHLSAFTNLTVGPKCTRRFSSDLQKISIIFYICLGNNMKKTCINKMLAPL